MLFLCASVSVGTTKFGVHSEPLRMCSVLESGGTKWNGSIPTSWDGFDPVFGSENVEERNGSFFLFGSGIAPRNGTA
jgi:hypothetical protein